MATYEVLLVKKHLNEDTSVKAFTVHVQVTIGTDSDEQAGFITDPAEVAAALADGKKLNTFAETLAAIAQKRLESRLFRETKVDASTVTIDPVKVEEKKDSSSLDENTTK